MKLFERWAVADLAQIGTIANTERPGVTANLRQSRRGTVPAGIAGATFGRTAPTRSQVSPMSEFGYVLPTHSVVDGSGDSARQSAQLQYLLGRRDRRRVRHGRVGHRQRPLQRSTEALDLLAAVAGRTGTCGLGTAVCLPVLRHPVHVGHRTATIDQLTGGRLELGVDVGGGIAGVRDEY